MEEQFVFYGCVAIGAQLVGAFQEAHPLFEQARILGTTQYDEPSEQAMSGFLLLTMYCIGVGDASKATCYVSLALNMARLLPPTDSMEELCVTEQVLNVVGFMMFRLVGPPTVPLLRNLKSKDPISNIGLNLLRTTFVVIKPPQEVTEIQRIRAVEWLDETITYLDHNPLLAGPMTFSLYVKCYALQAKLCRNLDDSKGCSQAVDKAIKAMDTPLVGYMTPMTAVVVMLMAKLMAEYGDEMRLHALLNGGLQQMAFTWPCVRTMLERFGEDKSNFAFFPQRRIVATEFTESGEFELPKIEHQILADQPEEKDAEPTSDSEDSSPGMTTSLEELLMSDSLGLPNRGVEHMSTISVSIPNMTEEWFNHMSH